MSTALVPLSQALHRPAAGAARYRLVCFHHAGGGAGAFSPWLRLAPPDVEIYALRLPGRESRLGEPAHTDPAEAVAEAVQVVRPLAADGVPLAYYGHSMGGALAYEVHQALAAEGAPDPLFLAVGATPSPARQAERPPLLPPEHDDDDLREILRAYAGTPPEVFDNPEFLGLVLGVLEADFALFDRYRPRLPPEPVRCPVVAFCGADDSVVPPDAVAAWRDSAAGPFEFRELDGGHFFVESHADQVLGRLEAWSRGRA
ncbi:thioesterase II family protein [Actinokineospora sp. G85]|uniref:thioesterase II family protein n=1 Tax=Actinokineospora sp. G85 TaxID=3406626 RepID=UPI003C793DDC